MYRQQVIADVMAKKSLNGVVHHIRKLAAVQTERDLSDSELLERFVNAKDEAAFTVLVERHGPMVHGVCNRILRNKHDADDACQAAFLVMARKAGSIRKKASLSSWLHGVAGRVAADLKRQQARRRRREENAGVCETEDSSEELTWREAQTILDEELQHLPERYRSPLILCYLDGKTRDEAAEQLGLSAGALHGRLERGRLQLRKRLVQRGFTLSAALLASALGEGVGRAALSPGLVISSTKAATALASGQALSTGVVAPRVVSLTEGVIKTMFLTKAKIGTAIVLCVVLLGAVIGGSAASTAGAQQSEKFIGDRTTLSKAGIKESDEEFIRRISNYLRRREPTPAEVHFFVNSKNSGRRQKLIDLFIQERKAQAAKTRDKLLLDKLNAIRLSQAKKQNASPPSVDSAFLFLESTQNGQNNKSSDEIFLRRSYLDLTGKLPKVDDVGNFLKSRDRQKRRKLIQRLLATPEGRKRAADFIEKILGTPSGNKAAQKQSKANLGWDYRLLVDELGNQKESQLPKPATFRVLTDRFGRIQGEFYKQLHGAKKGKKDVAEITRRYLDRLTGYVKRYPSNDDVPEAMLQIVLIYRSQGKNAEAEAWQSKLPKEFPDSSAARTAREQEMCEQPAASFLIIDRSESLKKKQKAPKK